MATRKRAGQVVALTASIILMLMATAPAWAATLVGNAGDNHLTGTPEKDEIYGLALGDTLDGRANADELHGGRGNDQVLGWGGNDYIVGGRGMDDLNGHNGSDRIVAADGKTDTIDCGPGDVDRVRIDEKDYIRSCEVVNGVRVQ